MTPAGTRRPPGTRATVRTDVRAAMGRAMTSPESITHSGSLFWHAGPMARQASELANVMRRVLVAFEQGDQVTLRNLISPSEDTLLVGSDASEWLYGLEAYEVSSAQAAVTDYSLTIHRIDAHEDGHMGWAAAAQPPTSRAARPPNSGSPRSVGSRPACGKWCSGTPQCRLRSTKRRAAPSQRVSPNYSISSTRTSSRCCAPGFGLRG